MYAFGDRNAAIDAALADTDFRTLVPQLFDREAVAAPAEPSAALRGALEAGLLVADGDRYRAGPRLVLIPVAAETDLPQILRPTLAPYIQIARDAAETLREIYPSTRPAAEGFDWDQVSHSVVAGMFLDMAMGNELVTSNSIARKPTGDTVVWAFERISAVNAYGVQWTPAPGARVFYAQLWHRTVTRDDNKLMPDLVGRFAKVAFNGDGSSAGAGAGADAGAGDDGLAAKQLLYLRHLKLVRRREGAFRPQIPVFEPEDTAKLLAPLVEGARELVADSVVPALDSLQHHDWWRPHADEDAYRHAAVRLVLEYGIDRVVAARIVPPFPQGDEAPFAWGRWLWSEADGPFTLMPNVVTERSRDAGRP